MLKEGWDVTNLYTIVPLRAAHAKTLIEQSIGRGLRLPYGRRTGVMAVDRLNIVAHDRFQEIIDEANRPGSIIKLQAVVLDPGDIGRGTRSVVSQSVLASKLGLRPESSTESTVVAGSDVPRAFEKPEEELVAQVTMAVIRDMEATPAEVPTMESLARPDVRTSIAARVAERLRPEQLQFPGVAQPLDVASVVARTTDLAIQNGISIPRIIVVPRGEVRSDFDRFEVLESLLGFPGLI